MKRLFGRLGRLFFFTMFTAQVAGLANAIRTKQRVVPTTDPSSDEVVLAAIFGPLDFTSTASSFRGGTLYCLYGGGVLDLRGATMDPAGARLHVEAFNGGGQILVPSSWRVLTNVVGLGGVGDARAIDGLLPPHAPTLTIEGWTIFAGFGVA